VLCAEAHADRVTAALSGRLAHHSEAVRLEALAYLGPYWSLRLWLDLANIVLRKHACMPKQSTPWLPLFQSVSLTLVVGLGRVPPHAEAALLRVVQDPVSAVRIAALQVRMPVLRWLWVFLALNHGSSSRSRPHELA
jgi:hypothetical protein